jgi:hypothetical protein
MGPPPGHTGESTAMSDPQNLSPRGRRKARAVPSALKFLVVLALPLIFELGLKVGWAQLPAPNPLVVPPLPPSPPAQLPAPVSTAVVPVPQAIPSLPAPYAAPGPRVFNCSCSGVGTPTHWMGQVTASGYSSASASAGGACAAYYQGKAPSYGTAGGIGAANFFGPLPGAAQNAGAANSYGSPGVAQSSSAPSALGSLPGAAQGAGQANSFGSPQSALSFSSAQQQRLCSRCACD